MHRLALLGCGDVAVRDYLPELQRLADRVELTAVCSRTAQRAQMVAEQFGARAWYTDYHRMLAECDADLVANLTPIQIHAETTSAALRSGRHVYSEKPLASTVQEAQAVAEEAKQRHLTLICAPCVLLFPQVRYARTLLQEGMIGPVFSARGQGQGGVPPWQGYTSDPSPFFAAGGGPALDMGVYPLHALTGLLGPARRVVAMTGKSRESFLVDEGPAAGTRIPIEVDDNWHLLLDIGHGCLASVEASNCVQATRAPQLELMGLAGTIAVDLLDVAAPVAVNRAGHGWEEVPVPHMRDRGPDHLLGIEHLVHCVDSGATPVLSAEHAIHVLEIVERAAQSAREGRAQQLETSVSPD
jgi:predicted dehydrogenase